MNTPQGFPTPPFPQGPPGRGPQSTPLGAPASRPSWMPQDQPPNKSGRNTALAVLALVVVIGAAAVVFLFTRDDDEASVDSPSPATQQQVDEVLATVPTPTVTVPPVTVTSAVVDPLPPPTALAPANLFTGTRAAEVIAEIGVARGAAPLRILHALIYPEYAFAQVQDPSIPANVDEYQWRGDLSGPAPVTLTGDGDLEANLFSDTEVNWAVIPTLVETALAQIPIEGAEVSHISVQRNLPFSDAVQIRVFVNGTRTSGYLDADAQGTVINVSQG